MRRLTTMSVALAVTLAACSSAGSGLTTDDIWTLAHSEGLIVADDASGLPGISRVVSVDDEIAREVIGLTYYLVRFTIETPDGLFVICRAEITNDQGVVELIGSWTCGSPLPPDIGEPAPTPVSTQALGDRSLWEDRS